MKKFILKNLSLIFIIFCGVLCVACGHNHSYTTHTVNPTETTNGYTRHTCECGEYYDTDITCLITFQSACTDNSIASSTLPNVTSLTVTQNTIFEGINETNNFKIANYVGIEVGQEITNSLFVTIVWQPRSQAEQECLTVVSKINKLCELSYSYNSENFLLRVSQYLRTARYTSNVWNIMGGNLDANFIDYVALNQGNIDVSYLREIDTFISPVTGEGIDFIHMFGVINAIENTDSINSGAAEVAGWLGDLCTLVEEIVKSGASGDEITILANQKFNSTNSTFGNLDLIADLDAINIVKEYRDSTNSTFAEIFRNYYLTTTTQSRKDLFLATVFDKTYTNATTMANDLISRIDNNFFATYFCGTLNINTTSHREQFLAVATAFASYFI